MMKPIAILGILTVLPLAAAAPAAFGADPVPPVQLAQAAPSSQTVFGFQLMTPEERLAYRQQMRDAKTPEERLQICNAHHEAMVARAKERGLTLPDRPRCGGGRMGMKPGGGMGPGAGMGPGGGMMAPGNGQGPQTGGPQGGGQ